MSPRHVRALRGAAAAWIATIVAATSHTLAGGGAPAPVLVATLGILSSPIAVALVGRRLSSWRAAATVLAAQGLFHLSFALTAGVDADAMAGHVHSATATGAALPAAWLLPDAPMLIGHVVAAAATVVVLYTGERMLRALGRGIRSVLRRASAIAPRPIVRVRVVAGAVVAVVRRVRLCDLSRRGPPSFVIAAH
ncbi:hypothetical protein ASD56_15155 [Microbacterium sp. Root166]|uniref:hypothetical protein n=1 Tax=Microbacterium sp. Root166 TaxID=1736478 RepID=UPI0006FA673C|nr:hypothetical protein [Microbacterium sp. Root166]KQZ82210.1 hypothetical protein ASD56_15155 [Microbacterium sp. Root166]